MAVKGGSAVFLKAGYSGEDVRHIALRVYSVLDTENGKLIQKRKVFIEGGDGDFNVDTPTRFVFGVMEEGWKFETFEQGGKSWPGLCVTPDDGDFEVISNDPTGKTLEMFDKCTSYCLHRYQIVLKHEKTGEIATTDPSVQNSERQGEVP